MKTIFSKSSLIFVATVLACSITLTVQASDADHNTRVIQSLLTHTVTLDQLQSDQIEQIKQTVAELGDHPQDAVTEVLLIAYPDYAAAVESSDDDNIIDAIDRLSPLADSTDRFLAADASFYLARTLMNNQQFEEALPRLKKLTKELADFSVRQGDAQYFVGVAQAGMLLKDDAIQSFMEFLQFNPDAAERLRVSAWRQIQQLQAIKDGKLTDIHQHMDFSRRRLELIKTDETTQKEQDDIVKMLEKLIKEQEKKEANASAKNSNTKKQAQQKPSAPKPQSGQDPKPGKTQQGGSSSNPNGDVVKKTYDDSPASPWSRLRDRSRDPANNAIKEKLPARYRDGVEKYYEAANRTE